MTNNTDVRAETIALIWGGGGLIFVTFQYLGIYDFCSNDVVRWISANILGVQRFSVATLFHPSAIALMTYYIVTFVPVLLLSILFKATPFRILPSSKTKAIVFMTLIGAAMLLVIYWGPPGLDSDELASGLTGGLYARSLLGMWFFITCIYVTAGEFNS